MIAGAPRIGTQYSYQPGCRAAQHNYGPPAMMTLFRTIHLGRPDSSRGAQRRPGVLQVSAAAGPQLYRRRIPPPAARCALLVASAQVVVDPRPACHRHRYSVR